MTGPAPSPRNLPRLFADAMAALGPFEPSPHIAVAVSGGADSMALALLATDWARARNGMMTTLTVDHRLREGSRAEALGVGRVLAVRKIPHHILTWRHGAEITAANLQAQARDARYALMQDWCRAQGILHLLVAHHREDQAETFLMRLARGSGSYGLAAMAPVAERPGFRLLRPLLDLPREVLRVFLKAEGVDWVEDPSNQNTDFTRVRVRNAMPAMAAAGLTPECIAETALRLGHERVAMHHRLARMLARAAAPDPAGFVCVDRDVLLDAPMDVALRALGRIIVTVGGGAYPPRFACLQGLYDEISGPCRSRTLGGTFIRRGRHGALLFCRELAAMARPIDITGPGTLRWDRRFLVRLATSGGSSRRASVTLGALGTDGWRDIKADTAGFGSLGAPARSSLPAMVLAGLPALRDRHGVLDVPHIGYRRCRGAIGSLKITEMRPFPLEPLAGGVFGRTGVDSDG
jgi:tRNA(Ile)-lysidine synthase